MNINRNRVREATARRWRHVAGGVLIAAGVVAAVAWPAGTSRVRAEVKPPAEPAFDVEQVAFFERQVRPILVDNCFKCHGGEDKLKGGLNLTYRAGVLEGGEIGPVVNLEKPADSLLLKAVSYTDDHLRMPPPGKLKPSQIDTLAKWIAMGLPWTANSKPANPNLHREQRPYITEEDRQFWSFQPVTRPQPPQVKHEQWVRTPIDAFILARLEAVGLQPAPRASKQDLIRRAYYDLIGLPPDPSEVRAFVDDTDPDAFAKLVDRLLDSPQYGEKWGRHWLDLVHYAESNSFERDNPKPEVWRYRDYVIRALNDDKPFDQFVREQLAGDELPDSTPESVIATGYYRLGLWDDESADPPQSRYDEMDDWVTVTGQLFLGLTLNCARCHDHKIDPVPQEDYYRFLAFFRDVNSFQNGRDGHGKGFNNGNFHRKLSDFIPRDELRQGDDGRVFDGTELKKVDAELKRLVESITKKLPGGVRDDFQYETNQLDIVRENRDDLIPKGEARRFLALFNEREELRKMKASADVHVLCVTATPNPPQTHVKVRGTPTVDGKPVEPGVPSVLGMPDPAVTRPTDGQSTGRRLALANWLTSDENPLTPRVTVNRIWQHHFGRGIVRSANDFGKQGERPTHPLLLDWLASEFVANGWSLKSMHRLIMNSSAYQMSSRYDAAADAKDPTNDLFWRFDLRRLTAEELRDSILSVVGRLNPKMHGPSIYPVIPREVLAGQSKPGDNWHTSPEPERYRRSVYIHIKRSLIVPLLEDFDAAPTDSTCPVRFVTTQPAQALNLLNSEFVNEQAAVFAARLKNEAGDELRDQVAMALRLTTQRDAEPQEVERGLRLIDTLKSEEGLSGDEALKYYCLVVLNLNEFVFVD